jgi:peptidyl-prolyl cis-trans isomerase C
MKLPSAWSGFASIGLLTAMLCGAESNPRVVTATNAAPPAATTTNTVRPLEGLFPDETVCKGTGVEVRRSQVDKSILQFKANASARGATVSESKRAELEALMLDKIVLTQLLTGRATADDKTKAKAMADKFVADAQEQAGSPEAFERQLTSMGFTRTEFEAQILERAICEEIVDRELKRNVKISEEQVKKYYEENAAKLQRPEMVRASHILIATRNPVTGEEFDEARKKEKRQLMEKLLERARKGEDFAALAKEFSEDPGSREKGGEYIFPRGKMVPEFEKAAFALQTNEVSDIVTTQYGYHIIKLSQRIAAEQIELSKVGTEIQDLLARQEVQEKLLPEFLKKVKQDAKLEYLNGAKPPDAFPEDAAPAAPAKEKPPAAEMEKPAAR